MVFPLAFKCHGWHESVIEFKKKNNLLLTTCTHVFYPGFLFPRNIYSHGFSSLVLKWSWKSHRIVLSLKGTYSVELQDYIL